MSDTWDDIRGMIAEEKHARGNCGPGCWYCDAEAEPEADATWYEAARVNPDGTTETVERFDTRAAAVAYAKDNQAVHLVDEWTAGRVVRTIWRKGEAHLS